MSLCSYVASRSRVSSKSYKSCTLQPDLCYWHLSLTLLFEDALSYYEAKLLRDVNTLPHGLLLTMSIPLASSQTTFIVYESIPLPMPLPDSPGVAIMWDLSASFLDVSDDGRQTATLSSSQLEHCIGSSRYSRCHDGLATAERDTLCLSMLFSACYELLFSSTSCPSVEDPRH